MVELLVGTAVVVVEQKEEDEAQEVKLLDFNLMTFFKGQKTISFNLIIALIKMKLSKAFLHEIKPLDK